MTNLLKTTAILVCCLCISFAGKAQQNGTQDRAFWVETLTRIADPVHKSLRDLPAVVLRTIEIEKAQ